MLREPMNEMGSTNLETDHCQARISHLLNFSFLLSPFFLFGTHLVEYFIGKVAATFVSSVALIRTVERIAVS